jgi:predicted ABC-type ATPase
MPNIYVIAGPNGAGKSTMARGLLSRYVHCEEFVNADDIARELSSSRPEEVAIQAGRMMLQRLDDLSRRRADFAFETTLASRSFAPWLRKRREEGYRFHLIFIWLPEVEIAIARVAARVASGGHNIPEVDIRRRYLRGMANFNDLYLPLADTWEVYDNSAASRLVARGSRLRAPVISDLARWEAFKQKSV